MMGLTLREEFRGKRLKGTAIELSNESNTGATQIAAREFLEITYPTHDLLKGIEAVGPSQGRPVVVMGERGLGNCRGLAVLVVVVFAGVVGALADTHFDALAPDVSDVEITQIDLVALRPLPSASCQRE